MAGQDTKPSVAALNTDTIQTSLRPRNVHVLILWGEGFDARAATICAAAFRQQGISTKVVAMRKNNLAGENGIRLVPDMTVGEAIDGEISALAWVIPCTPNRFSRVENDPRIQGFLSQSVEPSTLFLLQDRGLLQRPSLAELNLTSERLVIYEDWLNLSLLIDHVAETIRAS